MVADTLKLGPRAAAFALAAAVAVVFNTLLACAKDAYEPLHAFMRSLSGHDWTTQGLADVILFFGLGMVFEKAGWAGKMDPQRLVFLLGAAVVAAGVGLVVWYVLV